MRQGVLLRAASLPAAGFWHSYSVPQFATGPEKGAPLPLWTHVPSFRLRGKARAETRPIPDHFRPTAANPWSQQIPVVLRQLSGNDWDLLQDGHAGWPSRVDCKGAVRGGRRARSLFHRSSPAATGDARTGPGNQAFATGSLVPAGYWYLPEVPLCPLCAHGHSYFKEKVLHPGALH